MAGIEALPRLGSRTDGDDAIAVHGDAAILKDSVGGNYGNYPPGE
jgi:hypothetical protein